jgi:hypothetical protein
MSPAYISAIGIATLKVPDSRLDAESELNRSDNFVTPVDAETAFVPPSRNLVYTDQSCE